jgi:cyclohexyl-isocyanide hydratase
MITPDKHLQIGSLAFDDLDQIDLTGPFEVLPRLPNSTHRIFAKTAAPVRDMLGLKLLPDAVLADAPRLDVLHIPGGFGQEALMEDEEVLGWIRRQAKDALYVFAVCTGALICGAAGLIKGRRATTHWAVHHLLPFFGAVPVNKRVVVDGNMVFAAGVTSGIDGALHVAALLRGASTSKRPYPNNQTVAEYSEHLRTCSNLFGFVRAGWSMPLFSRGSGRCYRCLEL